MTIRALLFALLAMLFSAACQPQTEPGAASPAPTGSPDSLENSPTARAAETEVVPAAATPSPTETGTPAVLPERENRLFTPHPITPVPLPTLEEEMPITGEVPDNLLQQMVDDLGQRLDVSADAIAVRRAESVVWRDGSLGCPEPGRVYTQALVNGYRVTLAVGDHLYDYHASDSGYFFLCENAEPPFEGRPTRSSDR